MSEEVKGAFIESLVRNNSKIRSDRAIAIQEQAELLYKRKVEDLEVKLKRLRRERDNMLDLSPTNATSLMLATDFDAEQFVEKDLQLGLEIRNEEIKLEIAKKQYTKLFVGEEA